jgi:hypothetical protein
VIRYDLICAQNHSFEGWFRDSAAFDQQCSESLLSCPDCGSSEIRKSLMAPAIGGGPKMENRRSTALAEMRSKMAELRSHVETNFDYVGNEFPEEARKIHFGETDPRAIYGEASVAEIKGLVDDGVGILPLPTDPKTDA